MKLGLKTSAILVIFSAGFGAACNDTSDAIFAAWFAGWHETQFSPSNVSWEKYTDMFYAFANTSPDPAKLDESGLAGLPAFVSQAREHGVRPHISVGGWAGSRYFSTAVGSASNRTTFVNTIIDLAVRYNVDGLDFDWEYPAEAGIGCNLNNVDDTANFLLFLQELRAHPANQALVITADVPPVPWLAYEGTSIQDVSEFAKVLDFINIMNYDIWGPWSPTVGPNAPLNDTCASGSYQMGSAVSAVQAWQKAGMPLEKMVLGVPAYGHSYHVAKQDAFVEGSTTQLASYPLFNASAQPVGDRWDALSGETDVCGVKSTEPGGLIDYWGMITLGYLDNQGNPEPGNIYRFDDCSKTPFIYNPEKEIMVSYDDPQSMRAKGQFIKAQNLKGFSIWEAGGDYHAFLLDALRSEF